MTLFEKANMRMLSTDLFSSNKPEENLGQGLQKLFEDPDEKMLKI